METKITTRTITVQYFALLRDQRGETEEKLQTAAATPRELYENLRAKYAFTLDPAHLRVAINEKFAAWDTELQAGDRVVFIPPVAGG